MLIYNIDTGDGLTNGNLGEIVQINTKERNEVQVLAFQKSWRSFSPIIVCILAHCMLTF